MSEQEKIIELIQRTDSITKLRNFLENARNRGAKQIELAAIKRLSEVQTTEIKGEIELAFWKTIIILEEVLTEENRRTTRLTRTRQQINKIGERDTIERLVLSKSVSKGYKALQDRGMLELSVEAIVLKFKNKFDENIIRHAENRLISSNVDINKL